MGSIFYSPLQGLSSETVPCVWIFRQEKTAFRELIAQLELDPKCKGLPLSSFLILPFQRITRLKLLVQVSPLNVPQALLASPVQAFAPSTSLLIF